MASATSSACPARPSETSLLRGYLLFVDVGHAGADHAEVHLLAAPIEVLVDCDLGVRLGHCSGGEEAISAGRARRLPTRWANP